MPLGMEVGLGPGDFVFDGDRAPPGKGHSPIQFLAHVYCGQTAGSMKTHATWQVGTEVNLGPGHIVLDETQLQLLLSSCTYVLYRRIRTKRGLHLRPLKLVKLS